MRHCKPGGVPALPVPRPRKPAQGRALAAMLPRAARLGLMPECVRLPTATCAASPPPGLQAPHGAFGTVYLVPPALWQVWILDRRCGGEAT